MTLSVLVLSCLLMLAGMSAPASANTRGLLYKDAESSNSSNDTTLPTPVGLERDVFFWEQIFSEYTPDECVFHDEWNLDVVYYVTEVPRLRSTSKNHRLSRHIKSIKIALDNIRTRGRPSGAFEEKIYRAIPQKYRTRDFFADASDRVRCQRGVDLDPSFKRSHKYLPMIRSILKAKGLPEDLAYLPHLESGFNVQATSKAGAKGLWQFMKHTARLEGLKVKKGNDYRIDPMKATDAATDHLASLYLRFRSWELAITSYNYGQNGVMRAVKKFGPDYMKIRTEHKTSIFGFAARNYYPSFLAVRNVAMKEEKKFKSATTIAEEDEILKRRKTF
jgi:membrane-bound lytic murein transglycosylase D